MQVKSSQLIPNKEHGRKATLAMVASRAISSVRTHKHTAVRSHTGISIIHVVDAAVIEHSGRITLVYSAAREIDCIGVHDSGHTGGHS